MNYSQKIEIIEKISKAIQLYAVVSNIDKYIVRKTLNDESGAKYAVLSIEVDKLYQHSKQFKLDASILMDRRGKRKKLYYEYRDTWIAVNYPIYRELRYYIFKLLNKNDDFSKIDLEILNSVYKQIKKIMSKKKVDNANTKKA